MWVQVALHEVQVAERIEEAAASRREDFVEVGRDDVPERPPGHERPYSLGGIGVIGSDVH